MLVINPDQSKTSQLLFVYLLLCCMYLHSVINTLVCSTECTHTLSFSLPTLAGVISSTWVRGASNVPVASRLSLKTDEVEKTVNKTSQLWEELIRTREQSLCLRALRLTLVWLFCTQTQTEISSRVELNSDSLGISSPSVMSYFQLISAVRAG